MFHKPEQTPDRDRNCTRFQASPCADLLGVQPHHPSRCSKMLLLSRKPCVRCRTGYSNCPHRAATNVTTLPAPRTDICSALDTTFDISVCASCVRAVDIRSRTDDAMRIPMIAMSIAATVNLIGSASAAFSSRNSDLLDGFIVKTQRSG